MSIYSYYNNTIWWESDVDITDINTINDTINVRGL
jgi:hypothetical protein